MQNFKQKKSSHKKRKMLANLLFLPLLSPIFFVATPPVLINQEKVVKILPKTNNDLNLLIQEVAKNENGKFSPTIASNFSYDPAVQVLKQDVKLTKLKLADILDENASVYVDDMYKLYTPFGYALFAFKNFTFAPEITLTTGQRFVIENAVFPDKELLIPKYSDKIVTFINNDNNLENNIKIPLNVTNPLNNNFTIITNKNINLPALTTKNKIDINLTPDNTIVNNWNNTNWIKYQDSSIKDKPNLFKDINISIQNNPQINVNYNVTPNEIIKNVDDLKNRSIFNWDLFGPNHSIMSSLNKPEIEITKVIYQDSWSEFYERSKYSLAPTYNDSELINFNTLRPTNKDYYSNFGANIWMLLLPSLLYLEDSINNSVLNTNWLKYVPEPKISDLNPTFNNAFKQAAKATADFKLASYSNVPANWTMRSVNFTTDYFKQDITNSYFLKNLEYQIFRNNFFVNQNDFFNNFFVWEKTSDTYLLKPNFDKLNLIWEANPAIPNESADQNTIQKYLAYWNAAKTLKLLNDNTFKNNAFIKVNFVKKGSEPVDSHNYTFPFNEFLNNSYAVQLQNKITSFITTNKMTLDDLILNLSVSIDNQQTFDLCKTEQTNFGGSTPETPETPPDVPTPPPPPSQQISGEIAFKQLTADEKIPLTKFSQIDLPFDEAGSKLAEYKNSVLNTFPSDFIEKYKGENLAVLLFSENFTSVSSSIVENEKQFKTWWQNTRMRNIFNAFTTSVPSKFDDVVNNSIFIKKDNNQGYPHLKNFVLTPMQANDLTGVLTWELRCDYSCNFDKTTGLPLPIEHCEFKPITFNFETNNIVYNDKPQQELRQYPAFNNNSTTNNFNYKKFEINSPFQVFNLPLTQPVNVPELDSDNLIKPNSYVKLTDLKSLTNFFLKMKKLNGAIDIWGEFDLFGKIDHDILRAPTIFPSDSLLTNSHLSQHNIEQIYQNLYNASYIFIDTLAELFNLSYPKQEQPQNNVIYWFSVIKSYYFSSFNETNITNALLKKDISLMKDVRFAFYLINNLTINIYQITNKTTLESWGNPDATIYKFKFNFYQKNCISQTTPPSLSFDANFSFDDVTISKAKDNFEYDKLFSGLKKDIVIDHILKSNLFKTNFGNLDVQYGAITKLTEKDIELSPDTEWLIDDNTGILKIPNVTVKCRKDFNSMTEQKIVFKDFILKSTTYEQLLISQFYVNSINDYTKLSKDQLIAKHKEILAFADSINQNNYDNLQLHAVFKFILNKYNLSNKDHVFSRIMEIIKNRNNGSHISANLSPLEGSKFTLSLEVKTLYSNFDSDTKIDFRLNFNINPKLFPTNNQDLIPDNIIEGISGIDSSKQEISSDNTGVLLLILIPSIVLLITIIATITSYFLIKRKKI